MSIDPNALKIAKALAEAPVNTKVTSEALQNLAVALLVADRDIKQLQRQVADERDRIAVAAMQGLLSSANFGHIAVTAYEYADAMLTEREHRKAEQTKEVP
jgi:hypothetical protein